MKWLAVALAPPLLMVVAMLTVRGCYSLDVPAPLPDEARAEIVQALRGGPAPAHPAVAKRKGPIHVTLWREGRRAARVEGEGRSLVEAVADARAKLGDVTGATLQVDVVVARGRLAGSKLLRSFGIAPGLDGVGARISTPAGPRDIYLGADELVDAHLLEAWKPVKSVPDVKIGLDMLHIEARLAQRAALGPGVWGASSPRFFRWRAETFVETAGGTMPLWRGLKPPVTVTAETLMKGARDGGLYLANRVDARGRYEYLVDLATGEQVATPEYSLPRHAGTTYYLAQLYGVTKDAAILPALERAVAHLADLARRRCVGQTADGRPWVCLVDKGQRDGYMGSTALGVVALAEYRLATGDTRYDDLLRALVEWILEMQRPDGSFVHIYNPKTGEKLPDRLQYFDGEAALALARAEDVFKDPRLVEATERALDGILAFYQGTFAGRFFFGEEHWTCIAAEAAWPELKHPRYLEFCSDYAAFLRRQQFAPGEIASQPDLAGSYGFTPFVVPHNTPAGSRTETMISAYQLSVHHGRPDERIRRQVLAALGYLLRQQVTEGDLYRLPNPRDIGAIPGSTIDRTVRIDYVQHVCSAMLRAAPLAR